MRRFLLFSTIVLSLASAVPVSAEAATSDEAKAPVSGCVVGEVTERRTGDGRQADLYVRLNRVEELRASVIAHPERYDGLVILVEVPPYEGGDTEKADLEATAAMVAANKAAYPDQAPPACVSAPLAATDGAIGIYVGCNGIETRFLSRSFPLNLPLDRAVRVALNELGRPLSVVERNSGFERVLPSMPVITTSVDVSSDGVVTVDLVDDFPALSGGAASILVIDAFSRTVFQFPGVASVTFKVGGDCERFWVLLGGEGCHLLLASGGSVETGLTSESQVISTGEVTAAATTFPETIYTGEPNGYLTYYPVSANGRKVFLSVACHDGNDGVSGGACIDNSGAKTCDGSSGVDYSENNGSLVISVEATIGTARGVAGFNNLLERGYSVRIGLGTARNNIRRSNTWATSWNTAVHIPVHSNAKAETCTSTSTLWAWHPRYVQQ